MNLIQRIDASLRSNADIVIVKSYKSLTYPCREHPQDGPWLQFGYYIAPKIPQYDLSAFNVAMNNLIPNAKPTYGHNCWINQKGKAVLLSWLCFDEYIGVRKFISEITLTDDFGMTEQLEKHGSRFEWECNIGRTVCIWTAPSEKIATMRAEKDARVKSGIMKLAEFEKCKKEWEETGAN